MTSHKLTKIISGGQRGADLAALIVAQEFGVSTGGFAPPGFMVTGPIGSRDRSLGHRFNLVELPGASNGRRRSFAESYAARSRLNVDASDGTVAFRTRASPGTDSTINYCNTGTWGCARFSSSRLFDGTFDKRLVYRPCLVVPTVQECDKQAQAKRIADFVKLHGIVTLNVAGHRGESTSGVADFQARVEDVMRAALEILKSDGAIVVCGQ